MISFFLSDEASSVRLTKKGISYRKTFSQTERELRGYRADAFDP